MKNSTRTLVLLALSMGTLSACQTFEGLKKDFSSVSSAVGTKVASMRSNDDSNGSPENIITPASGACPEIIIDPDARQMTEYADMDNKKLGTETSSFKITKAESECSIKDGSLELRADLTFEGMLGPKAKRTSTDQPFFSYPYYVAVTDKEGNALAQEPFAASATFEKDQETIQLVETIRQRLPLSDNGGMPAYEIHIGFQKDE